MSLAQRVADLLVLFQPIADEAVKAQAAYVDYWAAEGHPVTRKNTAGQWIVVPIDGYEVHFVDWMLDQLNDCACDLADAERIARALLP